MIRASVPAQRAALTHRVSRVSVAALFASGVGLAGLLLPALHRPGLRLVWNVSASVPLGLYRIAPVARLATGDLVAVRPSLQLAQFMAARRYVEADAVLVKPVAAIAGQRVCRSGHTVTIDGRAQAVAMPFDSRHRPMPAWRGCRRLGGDTVFLLALNSASFDGRYFGPTTARQVLGRAVPVLTW